MSKTTVRRALAGFDAVELRELIMDVYGRSKEAKDILDFFADPDINKKMEQVEAKLEKEIWRYTRHAHRPRFSRIRNAIKTFERLYAPDISHMAELYVWILEQFLKLSANTCHNEAFYKGFGKLTEEAFTFLTENALYTDYIPRIRKALSELKGVVGFFNTRNPAKNIILNQLEHFGIKLD